MSDDDRQAAGPKAAGPEAALAREIRRRRDAAGLSQTQLANLVGYSREYVSRAERPSKGLASAGLVAMIDAALTADGELITLHAALHQRRQDRRRPAAPSSNAARAVAGPPDRSAASTNRQPEVDDLSLGPDEREPVETVRRELDEFLASATTGSAAVEVWERAVQGHGVAAKDRTPALLVGDILTDLSDLRLDIARCRSAVGRRRLIRVAAQLAGLMCLTQVKLDDVVAARRWARTAQVAALEVNDPETTAWVLAQDAYGRFYANDVGHAMDLARAAQTVAAQPCVGTALAAALEARAHAVRGRAPEAHAAIGAAESALSVLTVSETTGGSAFGYDEAQLRFHESNALTHLGDTRPAYLAQSRALTLIRPDDFMDRVLTELDRAVCLTRDGDTCSAAQMAVQAVLAVDDHKRAGIITGRAHEVLNLVSHDRPHAPETRLLRELLVDSVPQEW